MYYNWLMSHKIAIKQMQAANTYVLCSARKYTAFAQFLISSFTAYLSHSMVLEL